MPSLIVTATSGGGNPLVSGNIYSGINYPLGGIQLRHSSSGIGPVFIALPDLSGNLPRLNSGGSLSSGGLSDAIELVPGGNLFVSKSRLNLSGMPDITAIRYHCPAASSGGRLFWEADVRY